jgi:hypothetical protein
VSPIAKARNRSSGDQTGLPNPLSTSHPCLTGARIRRSLRPRASTMSTPRFVGTATISPLGETTSPADPGKRSSLLPSRFMRQNAICPVNRSCERKMSFRPSEVHCGANPAGRWCVIFRMPLPSGFTTASSSRFVWSPAVAKTSLPEATLGAPAALTTATTLRPASATYAPRRCLLVSEPPTAELSVRPMPQARARGRAAGLAETNRTGLTDADERGHAGRAVACEHIAEVVRVAMYEVRRG